VPEIALATSSTSAPFTSMRVPLNVQPLNDVQRVSEVV
jgi:hypothetical protein